MSSETSTNALQPWQFFVLAALGCATAITFLVRDRGVLAVVLLTLVMGATALVGMMALRAIRPLVSVHDDRSAVVGERTRAGLEQEKILALRTIKELEFDRAMGKISEDDFREMSIRLRARAARLMKQLDAGTSYRSQIERDLAKRLGDSGERAPTATRACGKCSTANDPDARFCKECGAPALARRFDQMHISRRQRGRVMSGGRVRALRVILVLAGLLTLTGGAPLRAQIEMPDPKQMSGIPRPVTDLPNGSISVRLIRGDLSNNIAGHPVELHIGDKVQTVKTDEAGRAQFDKLPSGTTVQFVAVVDGERLESQQFPAPTEGGVRLMLVATDAEKERQKAEEAKLPPITGIVVLGGESRVVLEPGEESVSVYYMLDILNNAKAPVNPSTIFAFDMPKETVGTTVLQGSSPLASNSGIHVVVRGPFPSGKTSIEVAGSLPVTGGTLNIVQKFPAAFEQLLVVAKKEGDLKIESPQIDRQQESPVEGATVIVGAGGALAAGQPLSLTLSGLAHHTTMPRQIALTLAGGIALIGAWAFLRPVDPKQRVGERKRLIARREKLLQDLVRLEHDRRRGRVEGDRFDARREDLVGALEHIYGALDADETGPDPLDRSGRTAPLDTLKAS